MSTTWRELPTGYDDDAARRDDDVARLIPALTMILIAAAVIGLIATLYAQIGI